MPGEPFHELISTHQQVFFPFCTVTVVTQTDFILTGINAPADSSAPVAF
ncbi:hypothetical protein ECSTECS1191_5209, partial [Escherichia coli STEC_S1191]